MKNNKTKNKESDQLPSDVPHRIPDGEDYSPESFEKSKQSPYGGIRNIEKDTDKNDKK